MYVSLHISLQSGLGAAFTPKGLDFAQEKSVVGLMSDPDRLRQYASIVMVHLENAHKAAQKVQERDVTLIEMEDGFERIARALIEVENCLKSVAAFILERP